MLYEVITVVAAFLRTICMNLIFELLVVFLLLDSHKEAVPVP